MCWPASSVPEQNICLKAFAAAPTNNLRLTVHELQYLRATHDTPIQIQRSGTTHLTMRSFTDLAVLLVALLLAESTLVAAGSPRKLLQRPEGDTTPEQQIVTMTQFRAVDADLLKRINSNEPGERNNACSCSCCLLQLTAVGQLCRNCHEACANPT